MALKLKSKRKNNKSKSKKPSNKHNGSRQPRSRGLIPGLGASLGAMAGARFGPTAATLGRAAGDWLGKITGLGDYKINKNDLMSGGAPPSFAGSADGVVVCHREFLTDISGSTNFATTTFPINPGLPATFPWLAQMAANFEEWQPEGIIFEFRSTSGTAVSSTNTSLGTVIMATNYDPADSSFQNKQQMEAYEFSTSTVPYQSCIHPVECDAKRNPLGRFYIRSGLNPSGTDIRFYDLGVLTVATVGMQSGVAVIGELWMSYKIRFRKPKISTPLFATALTAHYYAGLTTFASPIGTGVVRGSSTYPLAAANQQIFLPIAGTYLISMCWQSASGITTPPNITGQTAFIAYIQLLNNGFNFTAASNNTLNANLTFVVNVSTSAPGTTNSITFGGLTGMSLGALDILLSEWDSGVLTVTDPLKVMAEKLNDLDKQFKLLMDQSVVVDKPQLISPTFGR